MGYIVLNNKFKPFSYQEMLAPIMQAQEAHDKADAEINTLLENAALNASSFGPNDTAEKAIYDDLIGRLKDASGQLSSRGINPSLKREISNINKEYRTSLLPIQKKITKRAELAAEQRKLQSSNPNIRFTKNYNDSSLSDITDNSSYEVIDLANLYKTTAEEFGSKTSTLYRDNIKPTRIKGTDYYNVTTGYGYTPEEFIEGINDTNSDIYKFYKSKADAIDSRNDIDNTTKEEMKAAVLRGMKASAGVFKTSQVKGNITSDSTPTSKMIKLDDNLYELSGALYQYDEDGNLYKVGNKPTSKSTLPSSSGASGGTSDKKRIGRPDETVIIEFNKKGKTKKTTIVGSMTGSTTVGQSVRYSDLDLNMQEEVDKYIGDDETSNYNYYVDGKKLTIVPKKITITEPEQIDTEVE
jgi:hypothetical protein